MRFADIKGNAEVTKAFRGMIASGRIPHAILLHEDDGGGAMRFVQAFLQLLFCHQAEDGDSCGKCPSCAKISKMIHPDVHFIFPVGGNTTSLDYVKQFRELVLANPDFTEADLRDKLELKSTMIKVGEADRLMSILALSPLERGYRAIVIYLPEAMNAATANRLLKSIEEPPEKTQFLLVTHSPESVLQTISSRCQRIRIQPGSAEAQKVDDPVLESLFADLADSLCRKDLLSALETADEVAALPSREKVQEFCHYASTQLRTVFLLQQNLGSLAPEAGERQRLLAATLPRRFSRSALDLFSKTSFYVGRNISLKIALNDLVCKLYAIL